MSDMPTIDGYSEDLVAKESLFKIQQGDCLQLFSSLQSESIDLTFVDPPFNINYDYQAYQDNKKPEQYLEWCKAWLAECYRVTARQGTCWLAIGDEYVSELDVLAKQAGFYKRSHVVWYFTFGVACANGFARSHTHLLYYTKSKTKFTFNRQDPQLRVPSARQLVYKDSRANPDGKLPDNTWILQPLDLTAAFTEEEDTWLASRVCGTFGERQERGTHGNTRSCPQMPLAVMERVVRASSKPGDLVLDPMSGTFSTGEAAVRANRRFIGFELCEAYCQRGNVRLQAASQHVPIKPTRPRRK